MMQKIHKAQHSIVQYGIVLMVIAGAYLFPVFQQFAHAQTPAINCPALVSPGNPVSVAVNAGASSIDWVAAYPPGAPNTSYAQTGISPSYRNVPLPRPQIVSFTSAPTTPGSYEFRLLANGVYDQIGDSCPFTVSAGAPPTVIISATDSSAGEPSNHGTYTVTRSGSTASALNVFYSTTGSSATYGSDYTLTAPSLITIPASSASVVINLTVEDNPTAESSETVVVTLSSNPNYTIGSPNSATITITDEDGGDTTPPTVSITAPTSGATVSGSSVTVSANASDNIGVVGVQFKLDGVNLGTEDTNSPYSITWNSTTATNGSHSLTAVARDAATNQTTSTALPVTVSNGGGGGGAATYTAPTSTAPNGNTNGPINAGTTHQIKRGGLTVGGGLTIGNIATIFTRIINGGIFANKVRSTTLQISGHAGCEPAAGKILTALADGTGCWSTSGGSGPSTHGWMLAYDGAQEGIYALAEFNGRLYAGQGRSAGDGDVLSCNPANSGDSALCDQEDWVVSYNGTQEKISALAVFNGRLYAGQGEDAPDGDIYVCNPATSGGATTCEQADWSISYDGAENHFLAFAELGGRLYAGQGRGAGDGDVFVCNPTLTGDATTCNTGDWSKSFEGAQESIESLAVFSGNLYAGQGEEGGDADVYVFNGSSWSLAWNGSSSYSSVNSLASFAGKLYVGLGRSDGWDDVYTYNGSAWSLAWEGPSTADTIMEMETYNSKLFAGVDFGSDSGAAQVFAHNGSTWVSSWTNPKNINGIQALKTYNGKLYVGLGNGGSEGDIYVFDDIP